MPASGGKRVVIAAIAALAGAALWWRKHPSACPYGQRFWVEAPHPFVTRARLFEALDPAPVETILEIGPGTGYYTLAVARRLSPTGRLLLCDIQQKMLDHVMRRAGQARVENLEPRRGDAQQLPYDEGTFDAAYMVAVLGEIPDQEAALREIQRVLRPGGRLVVGELLGDPHYVTVGALRSRAARAGLTFERRVGPRVGYFAVLRKSSAPAG